MELDLITGPIKPKSTLAEGQNLELATLPEGDFPEFTALLAAGAVAAPSAEAPPLTPKTELPVQVSMVIAQEYFPTAKIAPEAEPDLKVAPAPDLEVGAPPEKDSKTIGVEPPLANAIAALASVEKPVQPDVKPAEVTPEVKLAPVLAEKAAPVASPKPEQSITPPLPAPALAGAPIERAKPEIAQNTPPAQPQPKLVAQIPLAVNNVALAPTQPAPTAQITTPEIAPSPDEAPPEPPLRIAPKVAAPAQAQPTPLASFAKAEIQPLTDDLVDLQFGIKIERQTVELPQSMRPAPQAAPVANQIATQLPQLITKAAKQTIELRLDPPELGRVVIQLTTQDTQVTAQIIADRADTVDLMRRHADLLTATLARAGFSDSNLSFQQGQNQGKERGFEQFQSMGNTADLNEQPAALAPSMGADGRLDIRL